ncbi:MAG: hypothetical protein ABH833_01520 [Parcubacteria group bacterium]
MHTKENRNSGFAAIVLVLIVGTGLLLIGLGLGTTMFLERIGIFHEEQKEESYAAAMSCIDHGYLMISKKQEFTEPISIPVGDNTCTLEDISTPNPNITISSSAVVGESHVSLSVIIDASTLDTISFEEL